MFLLKNKYFISVQIHEKIILTFYLTFGLTTDRKVKLLKSFDPLGEILASPSLILTLKRGLSFDIKSSISQFLSFYRKVCI